MKRALIAAAILSLAQMGQAAAPDTLSYQGRLTRNGAPVSTAVTVTFALYDALSGGTKLWQESQSVTPSNGLYSVVLGQIAALPDNLFTQPLYLGITINSDPEMNPRQALSAQAYSRQAKNASRATTADFATALSVTPSLCPTGQAARGITTSGNATSCVTVGSGNGNGTVTSVASGTGLTGGPITATGTLALAPGYQLPQGCGSGQIPKWSGSAWACQPDATGSGGGTVTSITAGAGLSGGTITGSGTLAIDPNAAVLAGNYLKQGGNALGTTAVLGTTNNNAVEIYANNTRALRIEPNDNSPNILAGHPNNSVGAFWGQTVAGGGSELSNCYDPIAHNWSASCSNSVLGNYSTVGGGYANRAGGDASTSGKQGATVSGGTSNTASATSSTVSGGYMNAASGGSSTVSGGQSNAASGGSSTVSGGQSNAASGGSSTVSGGDMNAASKSYSTVSGGQTNAANGFWSTISGGASNIANGNGSAIPGGFNNVADGISSFSAGNRAKAYHDYTFVWGGDPNNDTVSQANGDFVVYAPGGIRLYAGALGAGGCTMVNGASGWNCASDRALKQDIIAVDAKDMLNRVLALPVSNWRFKAAPEAMHVGPMAQDFMAAFHLGTDDKTISAMDEGGVALAAIQGLAQIVQEKDAEIANLRQRLAAVEQTQRDELAALRRDIGNLRANLSERSAGPVALRGY
jgi:trimeric autotransporter adhesin